MSHPAKLAALALQQIAKVLDKLTEEQLTELAEGRAFVEFRSRDAVVSSGRTTGSGRSSRSTSSKPSSIDIDGVVSEINALNSSVEVLAYLQAREKQLKGEDLKAIARALGPTVSATGRTKAALMQNIAEGTTGYRERSNAVFAGGWR